MSEKSLTLSSTDIVPEELTDFYTGKTRHTYPAIFLVALLLVLYMSFRHRPMEATLKTKKYIYVCMCISVYKWIYV